MLESSIEKEFKRHVETLGYWCLKMKVIAHAGFPDRVLLKHPAKVVFVELKAPGKKPRKLQKYVINRLKKLGFEVHVIDRIEDIPVIITE